MQQTISRQSESQPLHAERSQLDHASTLHAIYLSVFIPARNEAGNIPPLMEKLARTFEANALDGEVIFVDDGSTDETWNQAVAAAEQYPFLRLYRHRRTFGLTEAMRTGFRYVRGDVVIFIPADLESDPEQDIPKLLAKLNEGYDVVAGWRQGRNDGKWQRQMANWPTSNSRL